MKRIVHNLFGLKYFFKFQCLQTVLQCKVAFYHILYEYE